MQQPMYLLNYPESKQLDGQTDVSKLIQMVRGSQGIDQADALSVKYIDKAIAALRHACPTSKPKKISSK